MPLVGDQSSRPAVTADKKTVRLMKIEYFLYELWFERAVRYRAGILFNFLAGQHAGENGGDAGKRTTKAQREGSW